MKNSLRSCQQGTTLEVACFSPPETFCATQRHTKKSFQQNATREVHNLETHPSAVFILDGFVWKPIPIG